MELRDAQSYCSGELDNATVALQAAKTEQERQVATARFEAARAAILQVAEAADVVAQAAQRFMGVAARAPIDTPRQALQNFAAQAGNIRDMARGNANEAQKRFNAVPRPEPQNPSDKDGPLNAQESEALARKTQKPEDFARAGDLNRDSGQPQKAVEDYNQALKRDPRNENALIGRSQTRLMLGDQEGAVADAKTVLALDPKNQLAQLIVGHGDSIARGSSKMKVTMNFGAKNSAETVPASGLATGWENGGAPRVPAAASNAVLPSAAPGMMSVAALLAQTEERLGMRDFAGAVMAARQAVDAEPKNPAAWATLAEASNEAGNPKGALEAARTALALDPANAQALRAKAYAEFQLGDFHAAYEDALRATQIDPKNGLGFLYLAMAEDKLGKTADAFHHYERAVELDTTLAPLAAEAVKRLTGAAGSGLTNVARRHLMRGGAFAGSLLLILLGLLGTAVGKSLVTTAKRAAAGVAGANAIARDEARAVGPGAILGGNYRVTSELGRGGMGVVYAATDEALQRRVAIKQLQRNEGRTYEDLERFLKEARLVASLKHPNLAEIYNVINEGDLYLVFEYVDGESLDKTLARDGKVPPPQTSRWLAEVGAALDYAHGRKIIHRDLKPSNIMITRGGSAKVMDFGIAHQSQGGRNLTMTSASGTPPYMAPEQALGSVSKAADLYALAVMAYEMLTGERPFPGPDFLEQKLQKRYLPPSQRDGSLRRGLDAFFAMALDPDPTKRPPDAKAFCRQLGDACAAIGRFH